MLKQLSIDQRTKQAVIILNLHPQGDGNPLSMSHIGRLHLYAKIDKQASVCLSILF